MKRIRKRVTALLLSCFVAGTSILGQYRPVKAAAVIGPATAAGISAGETLQFIYSVLMGLGITINLKEMIRYRDPSDGWECLDQPASQREIDELEKTIERMYDNAVRKYWEEHHGKLSPTPVPTQEPDVPSVVTPAPTSIPPDIGEKIDSWREMKEKALRNKVLTMGAVAGACLKEAVSNWWDSVMDDTPPSTNLEGNPFSSGDLVGKATVTFNTNPSNSGYHHVNNYYFYVDSFYKDVQAYLVSNVGQHGLKDLSLSFSNSFNYYTRYFDDGAVGGDYSCYLCSNVNLSFSNVANIVDGSYDYEFYVPYNIDGKYHDADIKPLMKPALWVTPDLKKMLDDSTKSPALPAPVPIKLPSLDEIQDLNKEANNSDDEKRPVIIQNFINKHIYNEPTAAPQPTSAPQATPVPTKKPGTNPDPTQSPETTPSVTPGIGVDPDISPGPNPSGSPDPDPNPDPNPTGSPDNPDPDPGGDDVNPDDYKTDLRLVFPFCIPFDLIHLFEALDAEPEAPKFKIPVDIEAENPFTEKKVIDYHTEIVVDMSDYEQAIKVIRLFEVMFFILGLMLITRQHMIKG